MIYDNPTVGAKIESVEADGRRLKGKELFAFWDDFDLGEREIHAPFHLYQLENAESDDSGNFQLLTVTWIQEDDFDVMEFLIPQNVQKLIIRYRPRFPLNHLAHEMTVTATRSESGP